MDDLRQVLFPESDYISAYATSMYPRNDLLAQSFHAGVSFTGVASYDPGTGQSSDFGQGALAQGNQSAAFGPYAMAAQTGATAGGFRAQALLTYATAFGEESLAAAYASTAIGRIAVVKAIRATGVGNAVYIAPAATNGVAIGDSVRLYGSGGVVIGRAASSGTGSGNTIVGQGSSIADSLNNCTIVGQGVAITVGGNATAIGQGSATGAADTVVVGQGSSVTGARSTSVGQGNTISHADVTVLGKGFTSTAAGQVIIGTSATTFTDIWLGRGVVHTGAAQTTNVHSSDASGTNVAGDSFAIKAGAGTGTGVGGNFEIYIADAGASGSSLNSHTLRGQMTYDGRFYLSKSGVIPSGFTGTGLVVSHNQETSSTVGTAYMACASADTNASVASFGVHQSISAVAIAANRTGSGTYLPIHFYTSVTKRMDIGASGNVAFGGNTNSSFLFRITGSHNFDGGLIIDPTLSVAAGSNAGIIRVTGATLVEASSGNHGRLACIGLDPPTITAGSATVTDTAMLHISDAMSCTVTGGNYSMLVGGPIRFTSFGAGTATFDANGNISSVSDERLKTRVRPLPYGLTEVLQLSPVMHGWTKESTMETEGDYPGFIAQDVGAAMPEIRYVHEKSKRESYSLHGVVGALTNAFKEVDARLKVLENI